MCAKFWLWRRGGSVPLEIHTRKRLLQLQNTVY